MNVPITGSCLCGGIRYAVSGPIGPIVHCHCTTCRKAHGAAFSSVAAVADADFSLSGGELLERYESSAGKHRHFCSRCGTQLYAKRDGTQHLILRMGSLDDHPRSTERSHIWVSQKASWYTIDARLPTFDEAE